MAKVSVIIAGRSEQYFQKTIEAVLSAAAGDVEVLAVSDGDEAEPRIHSEDPRVKIIRLEKSIGQRAAYNLGVRESIGKYVMKIDAHCQPGPGFDEILQSHCPDNAVVIPEMRRLDPHKWVVKAGGKTHFMYFGLDLYCHFWRDYRKRPDAQAEFPEVMTGQGSCWFTTRQWNDHIGLLDEGVGSWGNVGIEVSLRTWLCGGSQIVNKNTWQAHWFRRDDGGFTYPMDGRAVAKAHNYTWKNYYFKDNAFKNQTRPFSWLIRKFTPPGWEAYLLDEYKSPRVIVYYTDGKLDKEQPELANAVRKQLKRVAGPIPIISVSQEPLNFGKNVCVGKKPYCYQSMYEQLLAGLKAAPEGSIVYPVEHDVFYHPSHFCKLPEDDDHIWFNTNRYYWRAGLPYFFKARGEKTMSHGVCRREFLIGHCENRIRQWINGDPAANTISINYKNWKSENPNVDIRHGGNLTPDGTWKREYFSGKRIGVYNLPGWGGPGHFAKKTGYGKKSETERNESVMVEQEKEAPAEPAKVADPAKWLHKRWNRHDEQVSPVRMPRIRRERIADYMAIFGYRHGAEVGVREGMYSEVICKAIPNVSLLCVDRWAPFPGHTDLDRLPEPLMFLDEAKKRLSAYNVNFIRAASMDAVKDVPDGSLDFVYIDANHTFDFVMQDIIEWGKRVRIGGMISGHDYFRCKGFGVVPAVDVYTREHRVNEWFVTDERKASWFWIKQ